MLGSSGAVNRKPLVWSRFCVGTAESVEPVVHLSDDAQPGIDARRAQTANPRIVPCRVKVRSHGVVPSLALIQVSNTHNRHAFDASTCVTKH